MDIADILLEEMQKLKELTALGAKQALTMNDVSIFTGLSKSHIYKMVCSKQIPHYKSGGGKLTYFDKAEVTAWLLKHRVKTTEEIDAEATAYIVTGKKGGRNV